jgi:hypothetical protein
LLATCVLRFQARLFCCINEERMPKKCLNCSILLDIPCVTLACPGHHNESVGEVCAYCAANEQEDRLFCNNVTPSLVSGLEDFEPDLDAG